MNTSIGRRTRWLAVGLAAGSVLLLTSLSAQAGFPGVRPLGLTWLPTKGADAVDTTSAAQARLKAGMQTLPLYFIANRGQSDPRVSHYVQGGDTSVYFTSNGVTMTLAGEDRAGRQGRVSRWAVRQEFVGANRAVWPVGRGLTPAVVSYFEGRKSEWKTGLPTYAKVVYRDLWPGIDLVYSGTEGRLKYTFLVKPGADPDRIWLAYRGATAVGLTPDGQLEVSTPVGRLREARPYVYQEVAGRRVAVPAAYTVDRHAGGGTHTYRFDVGPYDENKTLVLDPVVLVYAGYIGGAGEDAANDIAVDGAGNAYVTGNTNSSAATFPETVGPDLTYNGGANDAFVAKVNAAGTALVYAGYIGGSAGDPGNGIAVDGSGNAYVAGHTDSSAATFPETVGPDLTYNGGAADGFVAKVNPAGTALVYAGYIGGAVEDVALDIDVDGSGNAYVAGGTFSSEATFPDGDGFGALGGPDLTSNGAQDAFVVKVNAAGSTLLYGGYIGGAGGEAAAGIDVDAAGNAYVTGGTTSSEATFPETVGPDLTHNGGADAYVAKVNAAGTGLVYAGYIGGAAGEAGGDIAVDGSGNANVAGTTSSSEATFPVAVGPDLTYNGGASDAFVARVNAGGASLAFAGYIGGAAVDNSRGIAVDGTGNAYVSGQTNSSEATFPVTVGPDLTYNGDLDGFVVKITQVAGPPATLMLSPAAATNPVGTSHTVTATVMDAAGQAVPGVVVRFSVMGSVTTTGSCTTNGTGQCSFTYAGPTAPGADAIHAYADTDNDNTQDPGEPFGDATKTWTPAAPATLTLSPTAATNPVGTSHTVTATVTDAFGNPTPGITVRFSVTGSVTTSGSCTTNGTGQCSFTYQGPPLPGNDAITAYADSDNDNVQDLDEPTAAATKLWIFSPACPPGDDDEDDDGLEDNDENLFLTLLGNTDSDNDGRRDGNDDSDGDGRDDEDEDDRTDDECPNDSDGDGEDDEDEDDD